VLLAIYAPGFLLVTTKVFIPSNHRKLRVFNSQISNLVLLWNLWNNLLHLLENFKDVSQSIIGIHDTHGYSVS